MRSTSQTSFTSPVPNHVAIIMDGNGRWARARGLPRSAGHRAGAEAVRRTVEAAVERDLGVLTLFAFSADNWQRPATEVDALMDLFERHLATQSRSCRRQDVRLRVIGRRDRLRPRLIEAIERAEEATAAGSRLLLRLAVDYSAREAIAAAAETHASTLPFDVAGFDRRLAEIVGAGLPVPGVDLLIRTSGEQRLSDFLLWECAYAELYFTDRLWPDFGRRDLAAAIAAFGHRDRRFGGLPEAPPAELSQQRAIASG